MRKTSWTGFRSALLPFHSGGCQGRREYYIRCCAAWISIVCKSPIRADVTVLGEFCCDRGSELLLCSHLDGAGCFQW